MTADELLIVRERSQLSNWASTCGRESSCAYSIDPLRDPRWPDLLDRHPYASVFHTPGWLEALQRTYKYRPVAYTTSRPGTPLENGVVFCQVDSWLTGSRLVSLPFSDHCQPLIVNQDDWSVLSRAIQQQRETKECRYIELRPLAFDKFGPAGLGPFETGEEYYYHHLDLRPDLNTIFRNFHKSCIQRKIQRSGSEELTYEAGRAGSVLTKFYHLLVLTRRRHRLPPQPMAWFRNLIECLGDKITIRVLSKDRRPIAGILTLSHGTTLVYKYGCSDPREHQLGAMPFLFWKVIQEGKQCGLQEFDLGRSEVNNTGLATFKDRLGARSYKISYLRLESPGSHDNLKLWGLRLRSHVFHRMPAPLAQIAGALLYKHIG